jgi:hypothetical protein
MGLPYADTQCGFKAFRREAALKIIRYQKIDRWGFDPEMLFLARKMGLQVREVPVSWAHDQRSKLSYIKTGFACSRRWRGSAGIRSLAPTARDAQAVRAMGK